MLDRIRAWFRPGRVAAREGEEPPSIRVAVPADVTRPDPGNNLDTANSSDPRTERMAERLLEDESLRGDLEDAAWQPIQDWALARIEDLGRRTRGLDDDRAAPILDRAYRSLREATATLVDLTARGPKSPEMASRLEALRTHLTPPLVDAHTGSRLVDRAVAAMSHMPGEHRAGVELARRLASALGGSSPIGGSSPRERTS